VYRFLAIGRVQIQCALDASNQCNLVDSFPKKSDGATFHCSHRDYSRAVTRESIRRPSTALHKYVIDSGGSLGSPTEPPRAYYHSSWDGNSDLRCVSHDFGPPDRGMNTMFDAPRAKRTEIANMEVIRFRTRRLPWAQCQARDWSIRYLLRPESTIGGRPCPALNCVGCVPSPAKVWESITD
jgi:hypothetical protein